MIVAELETVIVIMHGNKTACHYRQINRLACLSRRKNLFC